MLKSLLLVLSFVPFLASADTPSDDISISIARPMIGLAFPWGELTKVGPTLLAQLHNSGQPEPPQLLIEADSVVSVVLKNCSSHDVRLWRENSSWGYANVSFIFTLKSGQTISIKKKAQLSWRDNAPSFYFLHPQEELVLNETLFDQSWDWTPDERLTIAQQCARSPNGPSAVTVTPVYSVQGELLCGENQIWTGTIQGEGLKLYLFKY